MFRTEQSVRLLQAVAAIAGLAVLLWSLGLPSLHLSVEAANLADVSDTLSSSASSTPSNHTISFVLPTDGSGVGAGEAITVTLPTGSFDFTNVTVNDIDFASTTDYSLAESPSGLTWGVATSTSPDTITFTSGTAVLAAGATVTIEIGTNATFGATGVNQIVNPTSNGNYDIDIATTGGDAGSTIVVILDTVKVTASVDTVFNFTVSGLAGGETVNGTTTTGAATATAIPFGLMQSGNANATTVAQRLNVETNASQGYTVTLQTDGPLNSSTGADIDNFSNGSDTNTPAAWANPTGTVGAGENGWGHWGITSEDDDTTARVAEFTSDTWIAASTSPRYVMGHDGPADNSTAGVGETDIGFKIEISALQEAADDYEAIITYVATPTF